MMLEVWPPKIWKECGMKLSGVANSSLVGAWKIPDADVDVAEVDVADIDVEVVYRVCNESKGDVSDPVNVTTVATSDEPIWKPVPVGSCVDVRVKPDQALKISGPPGANGTYDLVFIVRPKP